MNIKHTFWDLQQLTLNTVSILEKYCYMTDQMLELLIKTNLIKNAKKQQIAFKFIFLYILLFSLKTMN